MVQIHLVSRHVPPSTANFDEYNEFVQWWLQYTSPPSYHSTKPRKDAEFWSSRNQIVHSITIYSGGS